MAIQRTRRNLPDTVVEPKEEKGAPEEEVEVTWKLLSSAKPLTLRDGRVIHSGDTFKAEPSLISKAFMDLLIILSE